MGLFTKKIGPVFLKENSDTAEFIEKMQKLQADATGNVKAAIEKQISLAKYGEIGENNVAYELKTSGMDMYILRDIYLETKTLSAQIDFLIVTRKRIYIIECKNLIGNIEIDNSGNFIRTYELFGRKVKEGIYSPITQNQRHLQVIKELRREGKGNFFTKMMFESNFPNNYKSIVVLANPKTCLNARYAKKDVKEQVIRTDQLITYINRMDSLMQSADMSEKDMLKIAQFFLERNKPDRCDYAKRYKEIVAEFKETDGKAEAIEVNDEEIKRRLRAFRLEKSRREGSKPYYIFNDAQMEDLIAKRPKNKEELLRVSGFGNVKAEKYGDEILKIMAETGMAE